MNTITGTVNAIKGATECTPVVSDLSREEMEIDSLGDSFRVFDKSQLPQVPDITVAYGGISKITFYMPVVRSGLMSSTPEVITKPEPNISNISSTGTVEDNEDWLMFLTKDLCGTLTSIIYRKDFQDNPVHRTPTALPKRKT